MRMEIGRVAPLGSTTDVNSVLSAGLISTMDMVHVEFFPFISKIK